MPWQEQIGIGSDCGRAEYSRSTRTFMSGAEGEWVVYHLPTYIPAGYRRNCPFLAAGWVGVRPTASKGSSAAMPAQAMLIEDVGTRMQLMENQWLR
jgi:hypothetical protein